MPRALRPPWMAEGRATQEQLPRCARLHGCRRYDHRDVGGRAPPGASAESNAGSSCRGAASRRTLQYLSAPSGTRQAEFQSFWTMVEVFTFLAQRGFVWIFFRIIGTLRSIGIGYSIVLNSSVKGNVDEARADMVRAVLV